LLHSGAGPIAAGLPNREHDGMAGLGRIAAALIACLALVAGPAAGAEPAPPTAPTLTFTPPLPLTVVTPFRPPATRYGPGHRGVDLAAAVDATVLAAADGTVVYADDLAGRGVVSIEHDGGLRTTYEPVRALVAAGDRVSRGQPIGLVEAGHPPCALAACLHLGARLPDRIYLDPLALFGPWRVRLKPWAGDG
jgi:murein DD-endopeptidase MepM/ murein hydrolase activator NlpD